MDAGQLCSIGFAGLVNCECTMSELWRRGSCLLLQDNGVREENVRWASGSICDGLVLGIVLFGRAHCGYE